MLSVILAKRMSTIYQDRAGMDIEEKCQDMSSPLLICAYTCQYLYKNLRQQYRII